MGIWEIGLVFIIVCIGLIGWIKLAREQENERKSYYLGCTDRGFGLLGSDFSNNWFGLGE